MTQKPAEPDLNAARAQRRKPVPAPSTPAPGAVSTPAPTQPSPAAPPVVARGVPTVPLNVRVPVEVRDAVIAAAQNPNTPSQRAVIEHLVRTHLMDAAPQQ